MLGLLTGSFSCASLYIPTEQEGLKGTVLFLHLSENQTRGRFSQYEETIFGINVYEISEWFLESCREVVEVHTGGVLWEAKEITENHADIDLVGVEGSPFMRVW